MSVILYVHDVLSWGTGVLFRLDKGHVHFYVMAEHDSHCGTISYHSMSCTLPPLNIRLTCSYLMISPLPNLREIVLPSQPLEWHSLLQKILSQRKILVQMCFIVPMQFIVPMRFIIPMWCCLLPSDLTVRQPPSRTSGAISLFDFTKGCINT